MSISKPFRHVGLPDSLADSESRISKGTFDAVHFWGTLCRVLLPYLLLATILTGLLIYGNEHSIARAILFFGGLISFVWMAHQYEEHTKGHLVLLHGSVYPRLVYWIFPLVFFSIVYSAPPDIRWAVFAVVLVLGASGLVLDLRPPSSRHKSSAWYLEGTIRNNLRLVAEAIWFQFVTLGSSLIRLCVRLLYIAVFFLVCISLMLRRIRGDSDVERTTLTRESKGNTRRFSIAHLSDLHFMGPNAKLGLEGKSRNGEIFDFFKKHKSTLSKTNLIAITGDITDTGFTDEWTQADLALSSILQGTKSPPTVAVIPGNHDINIFMSFDETVDDLETYDKKLTLFGLGIFSQRHIRLVRYLAFWDKWAGIEAKLLDKNAQWSTGRKFLQSKSTQLNEFANSKISSNYDGLHVRKAFEATFPSVTQLTGKKVCVYALDSNASTWHVLTNSIGWFDLGQLWRLNRLLKVHPKHHGAIFLMHHHLKPGTKKRSYKSPNLRKKFEELFMITANAFIFRFILKRRLKQTALVLHGHTHFERTYRFGQHVVFCAPSTGYGEASDNKPSCLAAIHNLEVDDVGNISWIHSTALT